MHFVILPKMMSNTKKLSSNLSILAKDYSVKIIDVINFI